VADRRDRVLLHASFELLVVEFVARVHFACSMFDCIVFFFHSFLFFPCRYKR